MENSYSSYIKQVERALSLPQSQKKELLRGFQAELKEKFPDPPSSERLLNDMGQPEEVASALLEAIDTTEYIRFNSSPLVPHCYSHSCSTGDNFHRNNRLP